MQLFMDQVGFVVTCKALPSIVAYFASIYQEQWTSLLAAFFDHSKISVQTDNIWCQRSDISPHSTNIELIFSTNSISIFLSVLCLNYIYLSSF
ncbi:uncharacterized protein RJT21DRAFT_117273 [Scheffersomyces amazonensis]|uniref:uncharacterized protein n=1 Tax=Scheffersomyces amazonensis TaxID=1078765 RepID=UPI00315C7D0A